jgi:hypothetical protein
MPESRGCILRGTTRTRLLFKGSLARASADRRRSRPKIAHPNFRTRYGSASFVELLLMQSHGKSWWNKQACVRLRHPQRLKVVRASAYS